MCSRIRKRKEERKKKRKEEERTKEKKSEEGERDLSAVEHRKKKFGKMAGKTQHVIGLKNPAGKK